MKQSLLGGLVAAIIIAIVSWFMLPVLNIGFAHVIILGFIFVAVMTAVGYAFQKKENINHLPGKIGGVLSVLLIGIMIVGILFSTAIFRSDIKQKMLDVEEITFDDSMPNVDMDNLVIWDESDAIRFGEKLITEKDPSLGSMYEISSEYGTLSVINGKPHWLFPLEHSGLFKYLKNQTVPGYIKVNATTGEAEFVDSEFSVCPSASFGNDLKRVVYSEYKTVGLTDYSFEENEAGEPRWVITAYTHKTGFSTSEVEGVIVVDPVTKDVEFFEKDEQPDWIDRVSSMDIFKEHLDDWGSYINGWWNPSDKGKLKNTDGIGYVFKDGNIYFYTGITSYGGDEATTGFLIYNPRTCKAEYNRISGSTENKAMGLMEELVQNAGYTAKYPYLININGSATYLSTLKGNSGNVVGYALASVDNYRAVAWGKTLREAQTEYNRILISEGAATNSLSDQYSSLEEIKGTVSRVGYLKEGYFIVKITSRETLFVVSVDQYPLVALTEKGDTVIISYLETEEQIKIDALDFKNKSIE